jgi:dolichyl-phosphate-mannose--protein O-mannosyl transferase
MFLEITYYQIFGKPLIMYLGIITLLSFLFTAAIALLNRKGINKIPMEWHFRMAKISIALALVHGLLAMLAYL